MKKMSKRKLVLSKETLRSLSEKEVTAAQGGSGGLLTCDPEYSCYEMFNSERNC